MALKKDIVIVNEFTFVLPDGSGTRGATPGQFVLRYMSREDATEALSPVLIEYDYDLLSDNEMSLDAYTLRYMARRDATEVLKADPDKTVYDLEDQFDFLDGLSGRAFGSKGISLSAKELKNSSRLIQKAFDEGHTVQKLVLSFTEDYLRSRQILSPQYQFNGRGSYRGMVDQLKMRQAIMSGMERLTQFGQYENPEWVGTLQVDTAQLHAHIALTDKEFSKARMMDDGHDRGKISEKERMHLRIGLDRELRDLRTLRSFYADVSSDRQNVVSFVKEAAYHDVHHNVGLQLLVASLPKNKNWWRYSTNRVEMKRSNELAEQYVTRLFEEQPDRSGYNHAVTSVKKYVANRIKEEDIPFSEQKKLLENGQKRIIERSVNSIYSLISDLEPHSLVPVTPMTDIQRRDGEELLQAMTSSSDDFDVIGFELRVRGYQRRRQEHKKNSRRFYDYLTEFDDLFENDQVDVSAMVVRRFYEEELDYHMKLTDKYRWFFKLDYRQDRETIMQMKPVYEQLRDEYHMIKRMGDGFEAAVSGDLLKSLGQEFGVSSLSDALTQEGRVNDYIFDTYGISNGLRLLDESFYMAVSSEIQDAKTDYCVRMASFVFDAFEQGVLTSRDWGGIHGDHRNINTVDYLDAVSHRNILFVEPPVLKPRSEGIDSFLFDDVKALDVHHLGLDFYGHMNHSISDVNAFIFADTYNWRSELLNGTLDYLKSSNQDISWLRSDESDIVDMKEAVSIAVDLGEVRTVDTLLLETLVDRVDETIRIDEQLPIVQHVNHVLSDAVATDFYLFDQTETDL